MKKNFQRLLYIPAILILAFSSCNESVDLITANAKEGAFLSIEGSSGTLAGAPESGVEIEDAIIDFEVAELTYTVVVSAGASDVSELVVKKTYAGKTLEIARVSGTEVLVEYDDLSDFLQGLDVTSDKLRVGDVIQFQTDIIMKDGRTLVNNGAALNIQVSCVSDLTGTYSVTNTACAGAPVQPLPFDVTITKNADGSYHLSSADGGWLHRCTGNTGLVNAGDIVEQCGTILPSTALDYGTDGGYGIGDITGGTWDAATGTLTLQHVQTYFPARTGEWTSTYVRK